MSDIEESDSSDDLEYEDESESGSEEEMNQDDDSEEEGNDNANLDNINLNVSEGESDEEKYQSEDDNVRVINEVHEEDEEQVEKILKMRDIESVTNVMTPHLKSHNVATIDEYEIDSSDEEDLRNTVGNIPIEWYNEYSHIGYDWDGKKIMKPPKGNEVEDFLRKMEDPYYWRTVNDKLTGQSVILTDNDVDAIQRIKRGKYPDANYNPYQPFIDFFTYQKMIHPVTNRPETKASFIPSLSEKRKVSKIVAAIKRNLLKPKVEKKKETEFDFKYDLWEKEDTPNKRVDRYIAAPKMPLPGHEQSYNPPPEYLFNKEEEDKWKEQEPEERKIDFIPQKYSSLRRVPAYPNFVKERFERCLDLYLCPRARKMRANVDPEDLIPQLPRPRDLQPFPTLTSIIYKGHDDVVNSISIEPSGQYFISGSDDCTIKVWEVLTGRCVKTIKFEAAVTCVSWSPHEAKCLCAVVVGKDVFLINPSVGDKYVISETDLMFKPHSSDGDGQSMPSSSSDISVVDWQMIGEENTEWKSGIRAVLKHRFEIRQITWHYGGDYFAVVMPTGAHKSVAIHQLSKRRSQVPFKKSKGLIQCVLFHPSRPYFFVATKKNVRVYNLVKQELTKKLQANCNEISSMSVHPEGDNLIIGSYDLRLCWFDLDLSTKPYKTLRYHKKAIREVAFHPRYPLFASASDDATLIVSHGMVYSDLNQNPLIVPVKVLRGHSVVNNIGVTSCVFHPYQPWLLSSGADATIRLYT